jgi:hypothetical protein
MMNPDHQATTSAGMWIVRANACLTAVFVTTTVAAAVLFRSPWKTVSVCVDLVCFGVGVVSFLWGYWNAVQRSRVDDIGVAALYFLLDGCAPRGVSRGMNLLLAVQATTGVAGAVARGSTDGKPGSTLAFGILVPMLGLGLNGLWGAFHGTFPARHATGSCGVSSEDGANGQD